MKALRDPFFLFLLLGLSLGAQELRWTGRSQTFDHQDVFRVFSLTATEDHVPLVGWGVDDHAWPLFRAPADWKSGPFPGHDGKVVYRLRLVFDALPETAPAIFLGFGIDNDWTYFNGRLIGQNGPVGNNPTSNAFDAYRLYALPPDLILVGENILTVVVQNYRYNGGLLRGPYLFGPYQELQQRVQSEKAVVIGLLSIYSIVGLTFLLLALRNPREMVNWAFTAVLFVFTFYFFTRSQLKYDFLTDYMFWKRLEMVTISLAPPLFLFFLLKFFQMKHRVLHWVFYGASLVSILLYSVLPEDLQWGSVLVMWTQPSWLLLIVLLVYILVKNFRKHPDGRPLFYSIVAVLLALVYDVLVSRQVFGPSNVFYIGQYAFAVFIVALSWIQASRFARMYQSMEAMVAERTASLQAANEELMRLATRDHLTGLLNRAEWQRRLGGEWDRYQRYRMRLKRPFSVLFIDMDHFKDVNDTYGHQAGDELLIMMGQILSTRLRAVDVCARFGGDEFVILLPETTLEEAKIVADKILKSFEASWEEMYARLLAETQRPIAKGHRVGLSLGLAVSPETSDTSPEELLKKADQALYQAKESGKGRIAVAEN